MVDFEKCSLRQQGKAFDPVEAYGSKNPTLFTLKINHGGFFTLGSGRRYISGKVNWFDGVDADEFSVHELSDMLKLLGYKNEVMLYHYKIPNSGLEEGIKPLISNNDVIEMINHIGTCKVIEVYTELSLSAMGDTMSQPQSRLNLDGDVPEPMSNPLPSKKATKKPKMKFVKKLSKKALEKKMVVFDEWDGADYIENYHVEDNLVLEKEPEKWPSPFDMTNDFDPFFSNLKTNNGKGESSMLNKEDMINTEDDDVMVDEDNKIEDVEVDMNDFREKFNRTTEWEGLTKNNDVSEDEELDLEDFDSASDCDGDVEVERNKALRKLAKKQRFVEGMISDGNFYVGRKFGDKYVVLEMVSKVAVEQRRQLHVQKNDKQRVRVKCKGKTPIFKDFNDLNLCDGSGPSEACGPSSDIIQSIMPSGSGHVDGPIVQDENSCPWTLLVSKGTQDETWRVKTFVDTHTCLQSREIKKCTATFLSKEVEDTIVPNPKIPTTAHRDQLQKKYQLGVSKMKTYRAKQIAKDKVVGDYTHQYSQLRDYVLELKKTNPNTTVKIDIERDIDPKINTRQFKRIYVCLGALKKGFKAGNRELLGLDGCFMSGPWPGQIVTAVGVDSNNGTYPVAYAVVEAETKESWMWFLDYLGDDLDLRKDSNFTFISDRQKGIIPAISTMFPSAEHRFCLKHIHDNMKLTWRGQLYKDCLWKCATATTIQAFDKHMEDLKGICLDAYVWLKKIPPVHWSRSHFSGRAHCDVLLNNMCEVLNRQLLDGRDKPIITCLEYIREYLMKKIVNVQKVSVKCDGPLTPNATRLFKVIKDEAAQYKVVWNGEDKYQATGPWGDQCVVNMRDKVCSCRKWELTGMPCKHAVAAINDMGNNGMEVGLPEAWVHSTYWLRTWEKMYSFKIDPVNGQEYWPKSNVPLKLIPPVHHPQVGRPPKKRKKSAIEVEEMVKHGKLSRVGKTVRCLLCKELGHNRRSCKGQKMGPKPSGGTKKRNTSTKGKSSSQPAPRKE